MTKIKIEGARKFNVAIRFKRFSITAVRLVNSHSRSRNSRNGSSVCSSAVDAAPTDVEDTGSTRDRGDVFGGSEISD